MIFKSYTLALLGRSALLTGGLALCLYGLLRGQVYATLGGAMGSAYAFFSLYRFLSRRFRAINDFFEAVKYRDFSRWFSEKHGTSDIRELHRGFNLINQTFRDINNERQLQFLYLQRILELVEVGILAFNTETGEVLWANGQLLKILDLPTFRNINFLRRRLPGAYEELFETYHPAPVTAGLRLRRDTVRVLISDTVFQVGDHAYKLIVIQNIEDTLNRSESEAWKKLLSVMTHEIMNSIAPISSLSDTLQAHLQAAMERPGEQPVNLEDLSSGIRSISKRSEGLMKFAKTYRSLNKVTQLNRTSIRSAELFANIRVLMQPSLEDRHIGMRFSSPQPDLELEIDTYLIEQVLINLILNAMDACEQARPGQVSISAELSDSGKPLIRVADNGVGIPAEILETIFVPFFSTKKKGSGVGLSLCKQIMTLHGGQIQVRSRQGAGTEMRLVFP